MSGSNIDYWSESPHWAGAVVASSCGIKFYVEKFGVKSKRQRIENDWIDDALADMTTSRSGWTLVENRPVVAWVGVGLPPVETVCQCHLPDRLTNRYRWVSAKVIWHNGPTECAVIHDSCLYWCDEFRPALTQTQLNLEARQRVIEEMLSLFGGTDSRDTYLMQTLYDAGYRKFEIVDES